MSTPFPTKYRIVVGSDVLAAAITHLAHQSIWFEVDPECGDTYRITVKPEAEHLLPPLKDWTKATDAEILSAAANLYGPDDDGTFVPPDAVVTDRDDAGAWVTTRTWFDYPTDEAGGVSP